MSVRQVTMLASFYLPTRQKATGFARQHGSIKHTLAAEIVARQKGLQHAGQLLVDIFANLVFQFSTTDWARFHAAAEAPFEARLAGSVATRSSHRISSHFLAAHARERVLDEKKNKQLSQILDFCLYAMDKLVFA